MQKNNRDGLLDRLVFCDSSVVEYPAKLPYHKRNTNPSIEYPAKLPYHKRNTNPSSIMRNNLPGCIVVPIVL